VKLPRHRDPSSEYYIPHDPDNRSTSDPNAPVSEGPPYRFDAGAVVYQSELNPAPRRDPLEAVEIVVDITGRDGFDREHWHCARCHRWDKRARLEDKARRARTGPTESTVFASDPDTCNGCLLSCLDGSGPNLREVRDRLFGEWAGIRSKLDNIALETHRMAQEPSEKKRATEIRKRIERALEAAQRACEMAGFNPAKRRRQEARGMGEAPELGPGHERERSF